MQKKLFYLLIILIFSVINFTFSRVKPDFFISIISILLFYIIFSLFRRVDIGGILPLITAVSSIIIFSYGIVQKYILFPYYIHNFNSGSILLPENYIERIKTGRIFSIFSLPTVYSYICSILVIILLHLLLKSEKLKKPFWLILILLGIFNLFLAGSFSSVLYITFGTLQYLYFSNLLKKKHIIIFLMSISLLFFSITANRLSEAKKLEPVKLRLSNWNQAVRIINNNPFFGVGLGNYKNIIQKYTRKYEARSIYAHNFILQFSAEVGLFSLLFLLVLLFSYRKKIFKFTTGSVNLYLPLLIITVLFNLIDIGIYFFSSAILFTIILSQLYQKKNKPGQINYILLPLISALYLMIFISSQLTSNAEFHLKQKEYKTSNNKYASSLKINRFNYKNYLGLATSNLINKEYKKADVLLNQSLKINPFSGYGNYLKSRVSQIDKRYFTSLWYAFKAAQLNEINTDYTKWYEFLRSGLGSKLKSEK